MLGLRLCGLLLLLLFIIVPLWVGEKDVDAKELITEDWIERVDRLATNSRVGVFMGDEPKVAWEDIMGADPTVERWRDGRYWSWADS